MSLFEYSALYAWLVLALWVICPVAVAWALFEVQRRSVLMSWACAGLLFGLLIVIPAQARQPYYAESPCSMDPGWFHYIVWWCWI